MSAPTLIVCVVAPMNVALNYMLVWGPYDLFPTSRIVQAAMLTSRAFIQGCPPIRVRWGTTVLGYLDEPHGKASSP
jgi:hypothetical protein